MTWNFPQYFIFGGDMTGETPHSLDYFLTDEDVQFLVSKMYPGAENEIVEDQELLSEIFENHNNVSNDFENGKRIIQTPVEVAL
jgi:hypothetical protein